MKFSNTAKRPLTALAALGVGALLATSVAPAAAGEKKHSKTADNASDSAPACADATIAEKKKARPQATHYFLFDFDDSKAPYKGKYYYRQRGTADHNANFGYYKNGKYYPGKMERQAIVKRNKSKARR